MKKKPSSKTKTKKGLPGRWKAAIAFVLLLLLIIFYNGILKIFTPAWHWFNNIGSNPNYRAYKSFNIRMPTNYKIHGIDVSSYQGVINWQKVKSMREDSIHISFAFIKATEGTELVDPYFGRNWRDGPNAGIICGAYHFFWPEKSGKLQAIFFLKNVQTGKGRLPMAVDVERLNGVSPLKMREELKAFLKEIEAKTKVKPIIYTQLKFYQDNLLGHFDDYTLWVAHYYEPTLNEGKTTHWKFWQHSDHARVNGIGPRVDFDVFSGDSLAFSKLVVR